MSMNNGSLDDRDKFSEAESVQPAGQQVTTKLSGERILALRNRVNLSPHDIEVETRALAAKADNEAFFLRHSHLNYIETRNTVPGIYKLCSLALCLGISIEEMLQVFGVDVASLTNEYGLRIANETASPEPIERHPVNWRRIAAQYRKTGLLERRLQDVISSYMVPGPERPRYCFGVVGREQAYRAEGVPPGAIVQIDKYFGNKLQTATSQDRPIYFVWHDDGYLCSTAELVGRELTILPSASGEKLLRLRIPRQAEIIGKVVGMVHFVEDV